MLNSKNVQVLFGKAIRKLRKAQGLSQEELAAKANLHRTYIGDVERGVRNISIVNMGKLADALVDYDIFMSAPRPRVGPRSLPTAYARTYSIAPLSLSFHTTVLNLCENFSAQHGRVQGV
jgi:transcriptional regulator with XRE-family HTH domain